MVGGEKTESLDCGVVPSTRWKTPEFLEFRSQASLLSVLSSLEDNNAELHFNLIVCERKTSVFLDLH